MLRASRSDLGRVVVVLGLLAALPGAAQAGAVTSKLVGDKLFLTGGSDGDALVLTHDPMGGAQDVTVTAGDATTIDGGASKTFSGIAEIRLHLGNGVNSVSLQDITLTRSLNWQGGVDKDELSLQDCTLQDDLIAALRQGDDHVELHGTDVLSTLHLNGSSGKDTILLDDCEIGDLVADLSADDGQFDFKNCTFDKLTVTSGPNPADVPTFFHSSDCTVHGDFKATFGTLPSSFQITNLTVDGHMRIRTGNRDDFVTASGLHVGQDCRIELGSGDNLATLTNATVADELRYVGGSNADDLKLGGIDVGSLLVKLPGHDAGAIDTNVSFGVVAGDVVVKTGGANAFLEMLGATIGGTTNVSTGGGDNLLRLGGTFAGIKVFTGSGDDDTDFTAGATLQGDLQISTGGGGDQVKLGTATIEGDLRVTTGSGDDQVEFEDATVGGSTSIDTGSGDDQPE